MVVVRRMGEGESVVGLVLWGEGGRRVRVEG